MPPSILAFLLALGDPGSATAAAALTDRAVDALPACVAVTEPVWRTDAPIIDFPLQLAVPVRRARRKALARTAAPVPQVAITGVLRPEPAAITAVLREVAALKPAQTDPVPARMSRGFVRLAGDDAPDTLWREDDGLFYISARINGAVVRLIVDTGASVTVLSPEDARRIGVDPAQIAYAEQADTAAGATPMARIVLANLELGRNIASGVPAMVASGPMRTSLLGQNVLSRLGSVTIEGDRMTLR